MFISTSNGKIYMKKDIGTWSTLIASESDLAKLKKSNAASDSNASG